MTGGYCAHFYCDVCKKFIEAVSGDNAGQARKEIRERGWKLKRNGLVICDECNPKNALNESDREGIEWFFYK